MGAAMGVKGGSHPRSRACRLPPTGALRPRYLTGVDTSGDIRGRVRTGTWLEGHRVARHNREGRGTDQRGFEYRISYQPDWLRHVKVARALPSGRQSTMTLFRNPARCREREPGDRIRTRIVCPEQGVDVELTVHGNGCAEGVCRLSVTCEVPAANGPGSEEVTFIVQDGLPPAPSGDGASAGSKRER